MTAVPSPTMLGAVCAVASVAAVFLAGRAVGRRTTQPLPFQLVEAHSADHDEGVGAAAADHSRVTERPEVPSAVDSGPSKTPHGAVLRRRA